MLNAFQPSGPTVLVAATSSTGAAATQLSTTPGVCNGVRLCYPTTGSTPGVPVYVALGSSSIAAGVPTTATPALGLPVRSGETITIFVGPGLNSNWISAVTSAGSAVGGLYATPGYGQ